MGEMGTRKGADSGGKEVGKQEVHFGYVECVMPVSSLSANNGRIVEYECGVQGRGRSWKWKRWSHWPAGDH